MARPERFELPTTWFVVEEQEIGRLNRDLAWFVDS